MTPNKPFNPLPHAGQAVAPLSPSQTLAEGTLAAKLHEAPLSSVPSLSHTCAEESKREGSPECASPIHTIHPSDEDLRGIFGIKYFDLPVVLSGQEHERLKPKSQSFDAAKDRGIRGKGTAYRGGWGRPMTWAMGNASGICSHSRRLIEAASWLSGMRRASRTTLLAIM